MSKSSALIAGPAKRRNQPPEMPASVSEERKTTAQKESLEEHYAAVIGAFQDDPMLDTMMANIRERRRALDADSDTE